MNQRSLWKRTEWLVASVLVFLIFVLTAEFGQADSSRGEELRSLGSGWYRLVDGEKETVTLPTVLDAKAGEEVRLYNDTLTAEDAGCILSASGVQYDLEIRLGDTLLYRYEDDGFERNAQMKGKLWADVELPSNTGEEVLCLVYRAGTAGLPVSEPILGSVRAVMGQHLKNSLFSILMIVGMAGLGILAIMTFAYMSHHRIPERRFPNVAMFLVLCSIWSLTDSGLFQIYSRDTAVWTLVSFYAFMLMPIPMVHFVENTVEPKKRYLPALWAALFYGNAILQGGAYLLWGIPFIRMLFLTHILLAAGVASMIYLLYREVKRTEAEEIRLCLRAFAVLGAGGVLSLLLYWLLRIHWYDVIFQFGIILFVAMLFWGILCRVSEDIRFRIEQTIEERMARIDRMTGLPNRLAYDVYLEELKAQESSLRDVLLTFVHLEGLKTINDLYGMSAGDETVIGASRCLLGLKDTMPERFHCFRIEGDEFALVYPDPECTAEELEQSLEEELERYNMTAMPRERLELSWGTGYLHRRNGVLRTVSDWKSMADENLQENRKKAGGDET